MEFKEIIAELEKHKDTEEYNNYIGGFITPDRIDNFLESDQGKKFIQPTLDKYHSKGLESWKANNLSKLVEDEIKKRNPQADPKDLELQKLQAQIDSIQREATRKDLTNRALKVATEKGLPVEMVDYLIGEDEDSTFKNLETFEKVFTEKISASVENKLKSNNHVPPAGDGKTLDGVEQAFQNITGLKV